MIKYYFSLRNVLKTIQQLLVCSTKLTTVNTHAINMLIDIVYQWFLLIRSPLIIIIFINFFILVLCGFQ